jgi:Tfp pilus assembly protein PilF
MKKTKIKNLSSCNVGFCELQKEQSQKRKSEFRKSVMIRDFDTNDNKQAVTRDLVRRQEFYNTRYVVTGPSKQIRERLDS